MTAEVKDIESQSDCTLATTNDLPQITENTKASPSNLKVAQPLSTSLLDLKGLLVHGETGMGKTLMVTGVLEEAGLLG